MASSPVPMDWAGETTHPAHVDPASYDSTGLATQAGPLADIPIPGGGHPAAYSGLTQSAYDTSEEN